MIFKVLKRETREGKESWWRKTTRYFFDVSDGRSTTSTVLECLRFSYSPRESKKRPEPSDMMPHEDIQSREKSLAVCPYV